jgi:Uma2 family endonuclease
LAVWKIVEGLKTGDSPTSRFCNTSAKPISFCAEFLLCVDGTILAKEDAKMAPMELQKRRVSYDDLAQMPEDGRRYELYDGEVFVVPSPILRHQVVALRLWRILDDYASETGGLAVASPIDIVFSDYDVVQPDIVLLSAESLRSVSLDKPIRRSPDLAVEVLSPSTASNDRGRKMRMFQRYGVPEYWIVDPIEETIEIYRLTELAYESVATVSGSETMRSAVLPDLTLVPATVFPSALQ